MIRSLHQVTMQTLSVLRSMPKTTPTLRGCNEGRQIRMRVVAKHLIRRACHQLHRSAFLQAVLGLQGTCCFGSLDAAQELAGEITPVLFSFWDVAELLIQRSLPFEDARALRVSSSSKSAQRPSFRQVRIKSLSITLVKVSASIALEEIQQFSLSRSRTSSTSRDVQTTAQAGLSTFETDFEQQFEKSTEGSREKPLQERSSRTLEGASQLLGLDFLIQHAGLEERIEDSAAVLDRRFVAETGLGCTSVPLMQSAAVLPAPVLDWVTPHGR